MTNHTLYEGDALTVLSSLPPHQADTCVTSPPYFNLRQYGTDPRELGREASPQAYSRRLVAVFRQVKRVLKPGGSLWLVLGDCYAGSGKAGNNPAYQQRHTEWGKPSTRLVRFGKGGLIPPGLKRKDLMGVPWMVAHALQADGWYLRQCVIWAKGISGNARAADGSVYRGQGPSESCTDRPTTSHEYVFLLTPAPIYWYDYWAVREYDGLSSSSGRNWRSVWALQPNTRDLSHTATFPPLLVARCLQATCPPAVCPLCGVPYTHKVVTHSLHLKRTPVHTPLTHRTRAVSTGWRPPAAHDHGYHPACTCGDHEPIGGTVLDPFVGVGTTPIVARYMGRSSLGVDLQPAYAQEACRRLSATHAIITPPDPLGEGR